MEAGGKGGCPRGGGREGAQWRHHAGRGRRFPRHGLPHLLVWTPLVAGLAAAWLTGSLPAGAFGSYLGVLLAIDAISLGFDYRDAYRWMTGDRKIA